ncbi:MAG: M1 family metallopeptidase [Bacteroidota bacterium]
MKNNWHFLICLFLGLATAKAQDTYFQQALSVDISVQLDDQLHQLQGWWSMDYENNSPDTLTFIYLHLWPNAYQNKNTAFAQQMLRSGDTEFYFSPEKDLGFIDSLDFTSNGENLRTEPTNWGPDVIQVWLDEPLPPETTVRIESPFRLQFPASFSRLGHVGQSYQVTQWYPKPAVYDQEGWHPMPYLDYGEYYSEFMQQIDVYITLPENYVVAATGELQTTDELAWLKQKAEEDASLSWSDSDLEVYEEASFPESAVDYKQVHFSANWVHDFAWFADKRFHVLHDTVHIAKREPVDVWSFFTDRQAHLWQRSMEYLKRSTRFYSDHVGPYAYPQVSAVQSALSAGGGMEYPMITVIGLESNARQLDLVLAHEVGHNWFYGILASNERDHAWMDEGFNSYYEERYDRTYYGEEAPLPNLFAGGALTNLDEIGYRYYGCQRLGQAPNTPSGQLRFYNYWIGAYSIPQMALRQLEGYWGKEKLDEVIQQYYRDWQYKHPRPEDVQASLEKHGGEKLDWLFQGFVESTGQQDYSIQSVAQKGHLLRIENKGKIAGPVPIQAISSVGDTTQQWVLPPEAQDDFQVELAPAEYEQISIDPLHETLESKRQNNHWRKGLGSWERPRLRFITGLKNEQFSDVFLSPFLGFNEDDGVLPGLILTNRGVLPRSFEWYMAPLWGTTSGKLVGTAGFRGRIWNRKNERGLRELSLFGNLSSFHFQTFEKAELPLRYVRRVLGAQATFHPLADGKWEPRIKVRQLNTQVDDLDFSTDGELLGTSERKQNIYAASFSLSSKWVLSPATWSLTTEYADYVDGLNRAQDHLKLMLEGQGKLLYQEEKAFYWRLFAGFFLNNSVENTTFTPAQAFSLFDRPAEDYRFDNLYFARSEMDGLVSRQLALRAGGFRAPVPASFAVGRSNSRMISANLAVDLPFTPSWLPLKPYVDAARFLAPTFDGDENQFLWNGGLALEWLDGKVGVFLPLVGSAEIMDRLKEQGGLGERIGFRILLTELAPWKWLDELRTW